MHHGTVSRALNGDSRVRPETASRIQEIAQRVGYVPNRLGRGLRQDRTHTLGIIVPVVSDPFFAEVIDAVHDVIAPSGYSLIVSGGLSDLEGTVRTLWEHQLDGIFITCLVRPIPQDLGFPFPCVIVNDHTGRGHPGSVSNDDIAGMKACLEHLVGLGHRRIAYLGNRRGDRVNSVREHAFLEAADLSSVEITLVHGDGGDHVAGYRATLEWLGECRSSGVICFNDQMAIGALRACRERGVRVPDELSVVGFDDIETAAFASPGLTTYAQFKYELGARAARQMLHRLADDPDAPPPPPIFLKGELVVRESTAPCW